MTDQNVAMLLAHLKKTIIDFEAGYASMTAARVELHKVAANFQLQSIPLPETYTPKQTDEATFEVALWPNTSGGKVKASGIIDGTDYRVVLFAGTKEGVAMQGSIVPSETPEGSELKDVSIGYAAVKPNKAGDGYDLSLKFTQLEDWFNGPMEKVVSDNPKAPAFKAIMHKSAGGSKPSAANNPLLNVLQQLEVPEAAKVSEVDVPYDMFHQQPVAPVVPPSDTPDLSDFFNKPTFDASQGQTPPSEAHVPAKPDPVADLFASTTAKVPDIQVPSWLLS